MSVSGIQRGSQVVPRLTGGHAVEALTKGHLANDIKGEVVVPAVDVNDVAGIGSRLANLGDEQVDELGDELLLLLEGLDGEGVRQGAPLARVVLLVGHEHVGAEDARVLDRVEAAVDGVAVEVGLARMAGVDVLPGARVGEGQLVGRDADDWAWRVLGGCRDGGFPRGNFGIGGGGKGGQGTDRGCRAIA